MDAPPCGAGPHPVSDAVSSACSGLGGGLLTCYSPFRHWAPKGPVRLACLIHAASVHSEPGSNSPSLKSPMRRRSAPPPVDSIKIIKGFFSGRSPRDPSRGNHSIFKKNHVRSYCAARFPKSRRPNRRVLSHPLLYTAFMLLQAIVAIFPIISFFATDISDPALRRQSSVPRMTFTT